MNRSAMESSSSDIPRLPTRKLYKRTENKKIKSAQLDIVFSNVEEYIWGAKCLVLLFLQIVLSHNAIFLLRLIQDRFYFSYIKLVIRNRNS